MAAARAVATGGMVAVAAASAVAATAAAAVYLATAAATMVAALAAAVMRAVVAMKAAGTRVVAQAAGVGASVGHPQGEPDLDSATVAVVVQVEATVAARKRGLERSRCTCGSNSSHHRPWFRGCTVQRSSSARLMTERTSGTLLCHSCSPLGGAP